MANLVETAEWVDGIYQLETLDPVEGGPNGIDNLQAKQLGSRTKFLKALIEAAQNSLAGHDAAADPHSQYLTQAEGNSLIATAVSALVNSSPATLDTLNELAAALGNDPNFAASMATALSLKAPINSPVLTGNPTAPTQQQFDSSTKLATTQFVKEFGIQASKFASFGNAATLTNMNLGQAIALYGSSPYTITLPVSTAINAGGIIAFTAQQGSTKVTITGQSSQTMQANGTAISSISMHPGDTLMLVSGGGGWYILGGSAQSGYAYSRYAISPSSRVANTNYTNTTGKIMWVNAVFSSSSFFHAMSIGQSMVGDVCDIGNPGFGRRILFPVLPGEAYGWSYNNFLSIPTLNSWVEIY